MKKTIKFKLLTCGSYMHNGKHVYTAFVLPTKENNISQIPKGYNPRDIDDKQRRLKVIQESYEQVSGNFLTKNGGIQVIIDNGSFDATSQPGYIMFSCDGKHAGHYDGQHTQHAIEAAVNNMDEKQVLKADGVQITLYEDCLYDGAHAIRTSAQCINDRTPQKISSEMHIEGLFDALKKNISYTDEKNIGWNQNQKNAANQKIKPENEVQQVIRLLATLHPLAFKKGLSLNDICKLAKGGEAATMHMFKDSEYSQYIDASFKHVDYVLEISDYIQQTLKSVLGDSYDWFDMIKQTSRSQLKKGVNDRAYYKQNLFNGQNAEGALDKDFILMFVYALVNNCFVYDKSKREYICKKDIKQAKKIWDTYGRELLTIANDNFIQSFKNNSCRKSDFINQDVLWNELANEIRDKLIENHAILQAA